MKTAECVTPKHPDKMCDQISDAILDYCLTQDKNARVAVETMGGHGHVYITGEVTMQGEELNIGNVEQIVARITGETLHIHMNIIHQSWEIANGVNDGGAGDQGIMVGYACNDNEEMIPQELHYARSLCQSIFKEHPYDGKTQITLDDNGHIDTIVASFQNVEKQELYNQVIHWIDTNKLTHQLPKIYCNPAGDWSQGGFDADTGLTGRKLMVDNYGPQIPIGGGAFSGKDATKVDRSGAYMARHIAVDMLKRYAPDATECLVKIAYAIGRAEPVMVTTEMKFRGSDDKLKSTIVSGYDLTPKGIQKTLGLDRPQYEATARWGHFGDGFTWDN